MRIFVFGLITTLFATLVPADLAAQPDYFTNYPIWSSNYSDMVFGVALGDVDGDGDLDLVCGDFAENTLYENIDGIFSFTPIWSSNSADTTYGIALGDVDGDGDLDLVCGNDIERNRLYENIGGTFSSTPTWSSDPANRTYSVALGDVDGDGDLDLICGNRYQSNTLYENVGGTFSAMPIWSSGPTNLTISLALGDVDGDGDLDLACGNNNQNNTLYENIGGTFSVDPAWSSDSASVVLTVAMGDVDGDGDLDLVCGNHDESNTLYENIGGTFTTAPVWSSGPMNRTFGMALGDVDGDGDLDLVCGNLNQSNTLYENIDGSFSTTPIWSSGESNPTRSVALGDVDGDGDLDVISGNFGRGNALYANTGAMFPSTPAWSSDSTKATQSIVLGDVDGDGDLDLVCGNDWQSNTLYENTGETFSPSPIWSSGSNRRTIDVALGDVDGDGDLDLVCGNYTESNTLYKNNGSGFQFTPAWVSGPVNNTLSVALGDIDGDGDLDLACGNSFEPNSVYENIGGTTALALTPVWSSDPASGTREVALVDLDGDGDLDLVCAIYDGPNALYENTGGTFASTPAWTSDPANTTFGLALGDVDGDGDPDLVCANFDGPNTLYENTGGILSSTPVWSSDPRNATYCVTLADVDADGDLDLLCANDTESSTLYENIGGTFSAEPIWSFGPTEPTLSIASGDVDGDGDLDLLCGNDGGSNTLYTNIKNPAYQGDFLAPTQQLPNNGPFIGRTSVDMSDEKHFRVIFPVYDVESDLIWIVPDYQFAGESTWHPAHLAGGNTRFGPIAATPAGVTDSLEWDTTLVPFDHRDVVLRLRTVEIPTRVSTIQHASSYLLSVGPIVPIRPELSSSVDSLLFSRTAITVGDTASLELTLSNTGTADLQVTQITLPSTEMRVDPPTPFTLEPGQADTVTVFLEPRLETDISGLMTIASNDPVAPSQSVVVTSDIRSLDVTHELLKASDILPLGEAVTVVITPAPQVNVERGHLLFRAAGASAFQDSIALSTFNSEFVALIPGDKVTEAGLEYYIRVENSGMYGTDPPDAPHDSVYFQAVESPDQISVSVAGTVLPTQGRNVDLEIEFPRGTELLEGSIYYRPGGSTGYDTTDVRQIPAGYFATIPDTSVDYRGIEYWAEIRTLTRTLNYPAEHPSTHPAGLSVTVRNLLEPRRHPGGTDQSAYRMVTVPLTLSSDFTGTIEALLSDQPEFGSYDPVRWRVWRYIESTGGYQELSDKNADAFRPEPGTAFWLICRQDHRISTAPIPGFSIPTFRPNDSFSLHLNAQKWNMIGHPYAFPVPWDSVLVDSVAFDEAVGTIIDPPLRWAGGYKNNVANLEPFEGYWVYNRTDRDVVMLVPAQEALEQSVPPTALTQSGSVGWHLSLRACADAASDDFNLLGVLPGSIGGLDKNDRIDPPPPPGGLSLYFVRQRDQDASLRLTADMRAAAVSPGNWGEVWAFDIAKGVSREPAGDAVTITVDGVTSLPADAAAVLIDRTLDRQIVLDKDDEYTVYLGIRGYVANEEEARFRVIVGTESFVQNETTRSLDLPDHAALYQNYPNPFNPSTIIRYDIAEPGMVDLRVYNVAGALVRVLDSGHRERGRYEVGWDGENDHAEPVASGIYFYRLTAPGYSQTRKMVLVQ